MLKFRFSQEVYEVEADRNLNLLAHAQLEEKELGSRCGGHGHCGGDRVRVCLGADQLSPVTDAERKHLTPEELSAGTRLACQVWPEQQGAEVELEALAFRG